MLMWWNRTTYPIAAGRPHASLHMPMLHFAPPPDNPGIIIGLPEDPWLFRLTSFMLGHFGRSYSSIMGAQIILYALLVLITGAIAWRWKGPAAGFIASALTAYMPGVLECAILFDDHLFVMCCAAISVYLLTYAKGLKGIVFAAAAAFFLGAAMRYCFVASTGLMAFIAVSFAFGGVIIDEYLDVRRKIPVGDQPGESALKYTVKLLWPAAMVFALVLSVSALRNGSLDYLSYIFEELESGGTGSVWDAPLSLLTFPYILFVYQLAPVISCAAGIGLVALFRRSVKGRWTIAAWFFGLIIVCSLEGKKNYYYDFCAMIAAAPMAGVGLASLMKKKSFLALALLMVLGTCAISTARLTSRQTYLELSPKMIDYFQEKPQVFCLGPRRDPMFHDLEYPDLYKAVKKRRIDGDRILILALGGRENFSIIRYYLTLTDPLIQIFVLNEFVEALPRIPRPFLLIHKNLSNGSAPSLEEELILQIQRIEGDIDGMNDATGRAQFMKKVLARRNYNQVYEDRTFVLYDRD